MNTKQCVDRSKFCRFLTTLCRSKEHYQRMKRDCASTCGLCSIGTKNSSELFATRTSTPIQRTRNGTSRSADIFIQDLFKSAGVFTRLRNRSDERNITYGGGVLLKLNATIKSSESGKYSEEVNVTAVRLAENTEELNEISVKNSVPLSSRKPLSVPPINEKLKNFASSRKQESLTTNSHRNTSYLENKLAEAKSVNSGATNESSLEPRRITLKELEIKEDTLPMITTAKPETFTVSLAKTIIKGRCFDEYIYCREFSSLCTYPAFGDVMAKHCSLTCKRCDDIEIEEDGVDDCHDISSECSTIKHLCQDVKYDRLLKEYCPRSCGYCMPKCRDRHENCLQFADDDFCTDELYTEDERKFLCGDTCQLC